MSKIETNKEQKRNSLLDSAFTLFIDNGFNKTSIADIVKKAGVAKGTFYLYFKDKYDIRNHLISHKANQVFQTAQTFELGIFQRFFKCCAKQRYARYFHHL